MWMPVNASRFLIRKVNTEEKERWYFRKTRKYGYTKFQTFVSHFPGGSLLTCGWARGKWRLSCLDGTFFLIICWASILRKILLRPCKVSQMSMTTTRPCRMTTLTVFSYMWTYISLFFLSGTIRQKVCFLHFTTKNYFMLFHVLW
jgi:hypothetical protein